MVYGWMGVRWQRLYINADCWRSCQYPLSPNTQTPNADNSISQAALVGKFDPQTEMERAVHDLLVHARADKEAAVRLLV